MVEAPSTRASLLIRLKNREDKLAWSEFVDVYGTLVFAFARRQGWGEADAADLVQEVLVEVSKSIERFDYDPQAGRFRSWVYKIAVRTAGRMNTRNRRQPVGTGDSATARWLGEIEDKTEPSREIWQQEYDRQLIHHLSKKIRACVRPATWQAFWRTAIEGHTPQAVAGELGLSVGAVYVARNRVLKRLADAAKEFDDQ